MTKETIALHGTKKLLQQARKDLVAAGFKDDKEWNDRFALNSLFTYLKIYSNKVCIHTHDGFCDTVIDLTPENYEHVINLIKTKKDDYATS